MMKKYSEIKNVLYFISVLGFLMALSGCNASKETYEKKSIEEQMIVKDNKQLYESPLEQSVLYLTVGFESILKITFPGKILIPMTYPGMRLMMNQSIIVKPLYNLEMRPVLFLQASDMEIFPLMPL